MQYILILTWQQYHRQYQCVVDRVVKSHHCCVVSSFRFWFSHEWFPLLLLLFLLCCLFVLIVLHLLRCLSQIIQNIYKWWFLCCNNNIFIPLTIVIYIYTYITILTSIEIKCNNWKNTMIIEMPGVTKQSRFLQTI